jgi:hypothetical protein
MTADYGVAVTWGESKVGREKQGLDLFMEITTLYDKAVADGRLAGWDAVLYEPAWGLPAGEIRLLFDSPSELEAYLASDEYVLNFNRAGLLTDNVSMRRFVQGDALATDVGRFATLLSEL